MGSKLKALQAWTLRNLDTLAIVGGIILGLIVGFILKAGFEISPLALTYIGLPGTLIIRSIKLLIVPLLIASLSSSITSTKSGENKRLIIITFASIVTSLAIVTMFGMALVVIIRPGVNSDRDVRQTPVNNSIDIKQMIASQDEAIYDVLLNLVPDNLIGATFMSHYTAVVPKNPDDLKLGYKKVAEKSFTPNMLGLCAFALVLGFAVLHLGQKADLIKRFLDETNTLIMTLLLAFVKFMPIGMFSFMCVEAIKMKSPETVFAHIGWFMMAMFLVFAGIWFVIWPLFYLVLMRANLFKIYYNIIEAVIVAIGSVSSAVTLPSTMKCMEEYNHLSQPISHFVLPLGMTIHMPGTAVYYPMVAIFVAQMHGTTVTFSMLFSLLIYSVVQAMSLPGAPAAGSNLVFFVATCAIIGIDDPMDVLAYTMAIDWIAERIRTPTNIGGDCVVAMIVEKYCHMKGEDKTSDGDQIEEIVD